MKLKNIYFVRGSTIIRYVFLGKERGREERGKEREKGREREREKVR